MRIWDGGARTIRTPPIRPRNPSRQRTRLN